ncbi:MAG: chorismate mutase [Lachnospiraceae bacterium]|nr:chorismate mutase [Lachnospiraceae bacterium]
MSDIRKLSEVRAEIDAIDSKIRNLLMERMDCSYDVARAKIGSGDLTIYRPDREEEILRRLGNGIPEDRRAGYLAVVRKVMETSRMYQYGMIYDNCKEISEKLFAGIRIPDNASRVKLRLTRSNRPNSMSAILSMIGDYGYNMERMEQVEEETESGTVTFDLTVVGDLNEVHMKKLMYQLSMESSVFRILEVL